MHIHPETSFLLRFRPPPSPSFSLRFHSSSSALYCIFYDMRGSRSRIEWEITNLSHYSKGKEGKLEVQMSQIFIESLDSFPN
jgi:hypothetical protein